MKNKETKLTREIYSMDVSREWKRLTKDPFHKLEFNTTIRFLKKHLPKKTLILDAGGGPGRYSIELAKMGHDVILLDLVPEHLEFARKKIKQVKVQHKIKDVVEGTITDLSMFKSNSFGAVLCLGGALSHVHPEKDRKKAISELIRVAKKNAPIFISVMGKLGVLLATPDGRPNEVSHKKEFQKLAFVGDDYRWCGTGYAHFFTLQEFENMFTGKKVNIIERVGLEGLNVSNKITNNFAKKYPKAWKNWLNIHYKLCTEPTVVDLSGHMMIVVKKR